MTEESKAMQTVNSPVPKRRTATVRAPRDGRYDAFPAAWQKLPLRSSNYLHLEKGALSLRLPWERHSCLPFFLVRCLVLSTAHRPPAPRLCRGTHSAPHSLRQRESR